MESVEGMKERKEAMLQLVVDELIEATLRQRYESVRRWPTEVAEGWEQRAGGRLPEGDEQILASGAASGKLSRRSCPGLRRERRWRWRRS